MRRELADWVLERAYVPEHLVHYFTSILGVTPVLFKGKYLGYVNGNSLRLVGYPLVGDFDVIEVQELVEQHARSKAVVFIVGPRLPGLNYAERSSDDYYFVDLPLEISKRVRYMVRRASRELSVEVEGRMRKDHTRLVGEFLKRKDLPHIREVRDRLPEYVKSSDRVLVLSVYNRRGQLVGFNVVDLSARDYAFYMFNFIDRWSSYVPGASDLLMYKMLELASEEGKKRMNLGLGSSEGVRKFKEKWGAKVLVHYEYGAYISPLGVFAELTKF